MFEFLLQLAENPVFAGIAGGVGLSTLIYSLKAVPGAMWKIVKRQFSVELVIDNADDLFHRLAIHLSRSPDVLKSRWLRMVELYNEAEQRWEWQPSFGHGWHLIKDGGDWFLLHRAFEEKSAGLTLQQRETITIRTLGANQRPIRDLMKRAADVYESGETTRVYVFQSGSYMLADRKIARSPDTLFIPPDQKRRIIADMQRFLTARDDYRRRGIPYRRGYLFEGPPGTGKTTLAFVLACLARRPVYMINLNTCGGDAGLQSAFNQIEAGAFVVIEDADTAKMTHERTAAPSGDTEVKVDSEKHVTLAGLLNAVDGMASRENRVLIITSNHADKLDAALLRPGRIDVRERIDWIGEPEARAMAEAFGADDGWFEANVRHALPMSPAALQGLLLGRMLVDPKPRLQIAA